MDQTEFDRQVRIGTLNTRLSSEEIHVSALLGLITLNQAFQQHAPQYLNARAIAQSDGIVFDRPPNCAKIKGIWDLRGNGATVASVVVEAGVPTITATGFVPVDGEVVGINGLAALGVPNAYYRITVPVAGSFRPDGITAAAGAYTSGGIVWREEEQPLPIKPIDVDDASGDQPDKWYPLERQIVVDSHDFVNDILIDYERQFTQLSDLEADHHMTLVAFCVMHLGQPQDPKSPLLKIYEKNQRFYEGLWQSGLGVIEQSARLFRPKFNHKPVKDL